MKLPSIRYSNFWRVKIDWLLETPFKNCKNNGEKQKQEPDKQFPFIKKITEACAGMDIVPFQRKWTDAKSCLQPRIPESRDKKKNGYNQYNECRLFLSRLFLIALSYENNCYKLIRPRQLKKNSTVRRSFNTFPTE